MAVILGLNTAHAGSSAALLVDGVPVAAIAEERLNRRKYYGGFPTLSVLKCLEMAGLTFRDLDAVAIGRDSSANLSRKLMYVARHPSRLLNLLKIKARRKELGDLKSLFMQNFDLSPDELRFSQFNIEHHLAHAASAFYPSGWDEATGLTIDGSGDFVTCMFVAGRGKQIEILKRIYVPHSLGSLYTMVSEFIGYPKYGDEGKVMGLAPLGSDRFHDEFADIVKINQQGFQLNSEYFVPFGANQGMSIDKEGSVTLSRHFSKRMIDMFGEPREPRSELSQRDQDLAFAVQAVFEKVYLHLLHLLHEAAPSDRLIMAGGCALNSVANGKIFDLTPFQKTWIQPAAGDDGLALGAALYTHHALHGNERTYTMSNAYLGPEYSETEIRTALDKANVPYKRLERQPLLEATVAEIAKGNVVGWFQGRMEWGPRALGNRSILAHPGFPGMKNILNARVKHRESFRPFAPAVLADRQSEIFEQSHPSPFMLHVYKIRPPWRERLSAVNHEDNTGRLQSVARDENPFHYDLIKQFGHCTCLPVLLNTSFNENEPIVCQPSEAIECYLRTRMDVLVVGPFFCRKDAAEVT